MKYPILIRPVRLGATPEAFWTLHVGRLLKGFIGLFLAVFLTAAAYAEVKSQETELSAVLESEILAGTHPEDPNSVTRQGAAPQNKAAAADASVSERQETDKPLSENDLLVAKGPATAIERQLWQARTTAFEQKDVNQNRNELQDIIRRVSSIQLKPRVQTPAPEVVAEPAPKAEPNEPAPKAEPNEPASGDAMPQGPAIEKAKTTLPDGYVSEQTRQLFESLQSQPEQLKNPLELAEILFNSDCLKEAAVCYREALRRMRSGEPDPFQDKAWILLQLGNCLRNENAQAALENYRAVITECPDSPWVPLAKAKSELTDWYLQEQPEKLIHSAKR